MINIRLININNILRDHRVAINAPNGTNIKNGIVRKNSIELKKIFLLVGLNNFLASKDCATPSMLLPITLQLAAANTA